MKDLVLKVLRIRKKLLRDGTSKKPRALVETCMAPFIMYISIYPNATDQGFRGLVLKHYKKFTYLIPGTNSPLHDKYHNDLNKLLNF